MNKFTLFALVLSFCLFDMVFSRCMCNCMEEGHGRHYSGCPCQGKKLQGNEGQRLNLTAWTAGTGRTEEGFKKFGRHRRHGHHHGGSDSSGNSHHSNHHRSNRRKSNRHQNCLNCDNISMTTLPPPSVCEMASKAYRSLICLATVTTLTSAFHLTLRFNQSSAMNQTSYLPCEVYTCFANWVQNHKEASDFVQMALFCKELDDLHPNYESSLAQDTAKVSSGQVAWQYYHLYYKATALIICRPTSCSLKGWAEYYWTNLMLSHRYSGPAESPCDTICYLSNLSSRVRMFLNLLLIPTSLLLNWLNFAILNHVLGDASGTALYMHQGEIFTDTILCVILGLAGIDPIPTLHTWLRLTGCPFMRDIEFDNILSQISDAVRLLNQLYITALIFDRCVAMTDPFFYNSYDHKQRARKWKFRMLALVALLHVPMISLRTIRPFFYYEKGLDAALRSIERGPLILLVCVQAVCFVVLRRAGKKQVANAPAKEQQERIKKEKIRKKLLIGTVGLNLVVTVTSFGINLFQLIAIMHKHSISKSDNKRAVFLLGIVEILYLFDLLLVFCNGSLGVFIHVICTKSYRKAFFKTRIGKAVLKVKEKL